MKKTELIVALDVDTAEQAIALAESMGEEVEWVKVGKQLFTRAGPRVVEELREGCGKKVFLDLKFHDIPNTVAGAVRAASDMGVEMTNVHASGGSAMMEAAVEATADTGLILLAVTVLTSLDAVEMQRIGWSGRPAEQVLRLARLSAGAGIPGVVCSPREVELLRKEMGAGLILVVPGIRPADVDHGDQKRVMTPAQAVRAGADYIVVGRPVTAASDPAVAAAKIKRALTGIEQ